MRRAFALAITGLFLVSIFIGVASAAYTWAAIFNEAYTSAYATSPYDARGFSDGTDQVREFVFRQNPSQGAGDWQCSTAVCGTSFHGFGGIVGSRADVQRVSATQFIACFQFSGGTRSFTQSIDDGNSWSNFVTVGTLSLADQGCGISFASTTKFGAAYINNTNTQLMFALSTNSGASWTQTVAATTVAGAPQDVQVAWVSGTTWAIVYTDNSKAKFCKTTNDGASFACGTISTSTTSLDLRPRPGGGSVGSLYDGSTVSSFVTTDYTNYFISSVVTITGSAPPKVSAFNTSTWVISYNSGATSRIAYTNNSGSTFTLEDVDPTTFGGAIHFTNPAFAANGDLFYFTGVNNAGNTASKIFARSTSFKSSAIGATATATVTGLNGFDVDATGSRAVARVNNGEFVDIWAAKTLGTPQGGPIETNCQLAPDDQTDMAFNQYGGDLSAYVSCNGAVPHDPQYLSIRDPDGSTPNADEFNDPTGETCTPAGAGYTDGQCPYDIPLSEFGEPTKTGLRQLQQVKDFPIDYSNNDNEDGLGLDSREVSWAYSSKDGRIGVVAMTIRTGDTDRFDASVVSYAATKAKDICSGLDGGNYYIAAAEPTQNVRSWAVVFGQVGATNKYLSVTVQTPGNDFSVSGASSIACGGGRVVFATPTGVSMASRTGVHLWGPIAATVGQSRAVAISEQFVSTSNGNSCTGNSCLQYVAWLDEAPTPDVVKIAYASNGTVTGSVQIPSGSFKDMAMDRTGQALWVATSTTIAYYDIHSITTVVPVGSPSGVVNGTTNGTGNLFGGFGSTFGAALGLGTTGGNAILGFFLMVTAAALGFLAFGGAKKLKTKEPLGSGPAIGAGIFSVSMFFIDGIIGLFPLVIVLGTLLVGGAIWYFLKRGGGG